MRWAIALLILAGCSQSTDSGPDYRERCMGAYECVVETCEQPPPEGEPGFDEALADLKDCASACMGVDPGETEPQEPCPDGLEGTLPTAEGVGGVYGRICMTFGTCGDEPALDGEPLCYADSPVREAQIEMLCH